MNLSSCRYYQTRGLPDAESGKCSFGCRDEPHCVTDAIAVMRWACPRCGRFIAESAVTSEDWPDPGTYYGVTTITTGNCSRCGCVVDPRLVEIGVTW